MKEKQTHIQVNVSSRDKLLEIKQKHGYASIAVVIDKMISKFGDKQI